ncbi:hypothetical protein [Rugosimonospora africana]|uniref:Uncharacterized protein n=1 Tax=Rugosimonospora africana TaxID=556532 RepID=A0A8J3R2E1_9ACTN|nr:hypothetical protein [Rugosimonospora africana]GIH20120.1 hypothetical protein Raf01_82920 [Rugosimonospora africana]
MSEAIPIQPIKDRIKRCGDPSAIIGAADTLMTGCQVGTQGEALTSRWRKLSGCYFAPETGQLVASITPVQTKTEQVDTSVAEVGRALSDFGSTVLILKPQLENLLKRAEKFNAEAAARPTWRHTASPVYGPDGQPEHYTSHDHGHNPGDAVTVDNSGMHHEYSEISSALDKCQRQLAEAEADCVSAIASQTNSGLADSVLPPGPVHQPGQLGSEMPGAGMPLLSWEDDLGLGNNPFGKSWLDRAPMVEKISNGGTKALADGLNAFTRLVGINYDWDPSTGKSHWDFGAHVAGPAWLGLARVSISLGLPMVGGAAYGVGRMTGNSTLRKIGDSLNPVNVVKQSWDAVSGKGLPGGWGTRGGYLAGNVLQVAIPGPGKAGIAAMADKEGLIGAMARGAQYVGKGGWLGTDVRFTSKALGLGDKFGSLADRLPGFTRVSDMVNNWHLNDQSLPRPVDHAPLSVDDRFGRLNDAAATAADRAADRNSGHLGQLNDEIARVRQQQSQITTDALQRSTELRAAGRAQEAVDVVSQARAKTGALDTRVQALTEARDQLDGAASRRHAAASGRVDSGLDPHAGSDGASGKRGIDYVTRDKDGNEVVVTVGRHEFDPVSARQELMNRWPDLTPEQAGKVIDAYGKLPGIHDRAFDPATAAPLVERVNRDPFGVDEHTTMTKVSPDGKAIVRNLGDDKIHGYVARDGDLAAQTAAGLRDDLQLTYAQHVPLSALNDLRDLPGWLRHRGMLQPYRNVGRDGITMIRFRPHPDDIAALRTPVASDKLGWDDLPAHVKDEVQGAPYRGTGITGGGDLTPEMVIPWGDGVRYTHADAVYRHAYHGKAVETVFEVYRNGKWVTLDKPLTYYVADGTLVNGHVRLPDWLTERLGEPESKWAGLKEAGMDQILLKHSPREDAIAVQDGQTAQDNEHRDQEAQRRLEEAMGTLSQAGQVPGRLDGRG